MDIDIPLYLESMKIRGGSTASKLKALSKISLEIYESMHFLIGDEELIQTRRVIQHSRCKPLKTVGMHPVPSGSKAEGLDLTGSDEDVMCLLDHLRVYTLDLPNIVPGEQRVLLYANTLDTTLQPGFVNLKIFNSYSRKYLGILKSSDLISKYVSPSFTRFMKTFNFQKHGPCLAQYGNESDLDLAFCLPTYEWPLVAQEWPLRKRVQNWPNQDLIQTIVKEGCLFVPIGYEANSDSDTDWRISFSKAEKRLVFSLNHVQMLIYGLLKLFLKEVINTESTVNGLLCSYFMKTVLFWTIEESPSSLWVPNNFILCFWVCFTRLHSYVENKNCPNYFIKHANLFQRKITNDARKRLLGVLQPLKYMGIDCLKRSITLQILSTKAKKTGAAQAQRQLDIVRLNEICFHNYNMALIYGSGRILNTHYDPIAVFAGRKAMSMMTGKTVIGEFYPIAKQQWWQNICHLIDFSKCKEGNKYFYILHQLFLHFLIGGSKTDAVAGKLLIAAWLYKSNKFQQCLFVVEHALENMKNALYYNKGAAICLQSDSEIERQSCGLNISFSDKVRIFLISDVAFPIESELLPEELKTSELNLQNFGLCFPQMLFQPNLFGHFLRVLCYHKLGDKTKMLTAFEDIKQLGSILPNDPVFLNAYKYQHFGFVSLLRIIVKIEQPLSELQNDIKNWLPTVESYFKYAKQFGCNVEIFQNVLFEALQLPKNLSSREYST